MADRDSKAVESMTIHEDNIVANMEADDRIEVIRRLGSLLFRNGYVKDTYVQAVLDREVVFPTGLQTSMLGMAIPHTDTEHVIKPAIAIATLARPVIFQGMGSPETDVPVSVVMMLAVSDPKSVIPVLRSVLFILEKSEALDALTKATSQLEIKKVVQNHIQSMAGLLSSEAASENMH
jgi:PTS system galactitol-specific IIA component